MSTNDLQHHQCIALSVSVESEEEETSSDSTVVEQQSSPQPQPKPQPRPYQEKVEEGLDEDDNEDDASEEDGGAGESSLSASLRGSMEPPLASGSFSGALDFLKNKDPSKILHHTADHAEERSFSDLNRLMNPDVRPRAINTSDGGSSSDMSSDIRRKTPVDDLKEEARKNPLQISAELEHDLRYELFVSTRIDIDDDVEDKFASGSADLQAVFGGAAALLHTSMVVESEDLVVAKTKSGQQQIVKGTPEAIMEQLCRWLNDKELSEKDRKHAKHQARCLCLTFPKFGVERRALVLEAKRLHADRIFRNLLGIGSRRGLSQTSSKNSSMASSLNLVPGSPKPGGRRRSLSRGLKNMSVKFKSNRIISGDPNSVSLTELNSRDLALLITEIDLLKFHQITPDDWLFRRWERKKHVEGEDYPAVFIAVERWVRLCDWVVSNVISCDDLQPRVKMVKWFLNLGSHLAEMGNYHSTMAVVSSLNSVALSRLKKTWNELPSSSQKKRDHLDHLCSPIKHFHNYQKNKKERFPEGTRCLPFLGLVTQELTTLDEASENFVDDGLLNFDKAIMIGQIVAEFLDSIGERKPQSSKEVAQPGTMEFLCYTIASTLPSKHTSEQAYQRSLQLEPIGGGK